MGNLTQAIETLGKRDWFDYISAFTPIVLSIIAVWIAITTARKQNQIALFTLKNEIYHKLMSFVKNWQAGCNCILGTQNERETQLGCIAAFMYWSGNREDIGSVAQSFFKENIYCADLAILLSAYSDRDVSILIDIRNVFSCIDSKDIEDLSQAYNSFIKEFSSALWKKLDVDQLKLYTKQFSDELDAFDKKVRKKMQAEIMRIKE